VNNPIDLDYHTRVGLTFLEASCSHYTLARAVSFI